MTSQDSASIVWKAHSGAFAWPTLLLWAGVCLSWILIWIGVIDGRLGLVTGSGIATLLAYIVFTPLHEATHGNVSGRRRGFSFVDSILGCTSSTLLFSPFQFFRLMHLRHHAKTNDPDHDPDNWMKGRNPFLLLVKCLTILPVYYYHYFAKPSKETRDKLPNTLVHSAVIAALFVGLGLQFGWWAPVFLWLLPAVFAIVVLAMTFDWIPHHPHRERARYKDTRVVIFPGLEFLLLWQNYHLMHHLYPVVPFYRYGKLFESSRALLKEKGSPILDLRPWHKGAP